MRNAGQRYRLHLRPCLSGQYQNLRCGKKIVHLLFSLLLLATVLRLENPVQAGTSLAVTPSGKEIAWRAGVPITYHIDQGPLGSLSNAQAVALVDELFALWQNVPTANLSIQRAGVLPVDVTAANYSSYGQINSADPYHPIIFDTDGTITDAVLGVGASTFIAGFAGPSWTVGGNADGEITDAAAVLNAKYLTSGFGSVIEFKASILHELGHFLGLGHSQVNLGTAFDREILFKNNHTLPIMFPLSLGDRPVELTWDDKAQLTRMYPGVSNTGTIKGRVFLADGTTPLQGANVIARRVDDPFVIAVSSISGFLFRGTGPNANRGTLDPSYQGYFEISGLPAGNYTVEVEPIHPGFVSSASVGPLDPPVDLPGPAEYYSGSEESNSDSSTSAKLIAVGSRQIVENINFILNNSPLPITNESEPNNSVATANNISFPVIISGNVSASDAGVNDPTTGESVKDFYSFIAEANDWVTIDLNDGAPNTDLTLYLYNNSNQRVALSVPCSYGSRCISSRQIGPMKMPASGQYTIGVGANSGSTSYTLQVTTQRNFNGSATTVNGASFLTNGALAPETIASVFGVNLASSTISATPGQALPTNLGGVQVEVEGVLAQLFFVSPGQINYLIPAQTTGGTKSVVVRNGVGEVARGNIQIATTSPAFFTATQNGSGVPAGYVTRIAAGTSQITNEPIYTVTGGVVTPITIQRRNDQLFLILFGTGIRYAPNTNTANDIPLPGGGTLPNVAESLEITIGGRVARVDFAGGQSQFYGLDQVNVLIPADAVASPTVPVIIKVRDANGNLVTANQMTIALQ